MAKVTARPVEPEMHLYRVHFRRAPKEGLAVKTWTFVTFGVNEDDAKGRVWNAYRGSSFQSEFDYESASVEFILSGILKTGGN